jgi:DNA-binding response OmpR family regulator
MPSDIETGLTAGFSAYLTKPLDMEVLLSTVRQLLTSPPP